MIYIISGPTGAGKNTAADELAKLLVTAAIIDFDSIRAMHTKPHYTPWDGKAGKVQNDTTIEILCHIANKMLSTGRTPIILDVINNEGVELYRGKLEERPKVIQLTPSWDAIIERNKVREEKEGRIRLTPGQLKDVYDEQKNFTDYDKLIDNTNLSPSDTARAILE